MAEIRQANATARRHRVQTITTFPCSVVPTDKDGGYVLVKPCGMKPLYNDAVAARWYGPTIPRQFEQEIEVWSIVVRDVRKATKMLGATDLMSA